MNSRMRRLLRPFGISLFSHRWLFAVTAGYLTVSVTVAADIGKLSTIDTTMYSRTLPAALLMLAGIALFHCLFQLARRHPPRPFAFLAAEVRTLLSIERIAAALPVFVAVPPFLAVFTSMKNLIPLLNPYHWDASLAVLDRTLHGGMDPWRLLQPVLGHVWVTATLGWCYQVWFLFIFGSWFVLAFSTQRPRLRMQYLIAAVLTWGCVGTFAAILLSSAGPVYYGRIVGGPNPFAPLTAYLQGVHAVTTLFPFDAQNYLWNNYLTGHKAIGSGISAMPSMHVAAALLFALLLRGRHRVLGWAGFLYVGVIMIASVHLGWHYAVDGYISVGITLLLWRAAGWLTYRMPEFAPASDATPAAQPVFA